MVLRYMRCTAPECNQCDVWYRTIECAHSSRFYAYQEADTEHSHKPFNDEKFSNQQAWHRGISPKVKEAIEKVMFEKDISKPFRIRMNLIKKIEKKELVGHLPSLKQIQNFLYAQRKARGE